MTVSLAALSSLRVTPGSNTGELFLNAFLAARSESMKPVWAWVSSNIARLTTGSSNPPPRRRPPAMFSRGRKIDTAMAVIGWITRVRGADRIDS